MMINTHCPHCKAHNEIPEPYLGREVTCPSCRGGYLADRPVKSISSPIIRREERLPPKVKAPVFAPQDANVSKPFPVVPILIGLFIFVFIYVNRTSIFPPPKDNSGLDRPPAIEVRPTIQIWEYKVERFNNALATDRKDTVVLREYDDAKNPTAVFIEQSELDSFGSEGWELVSTYLEMETAFFNFGNSDLHTGIKENVRPQAVVAIFKRPRR
jgi:hypothetical protein